jgi:hypothetical protein
MVIDSIEYLMDAFVLPDRWSTAAEALHKLLTTAPTAPPTAASVTPDTTLAIALLQVVGLAAGFAAARFYAAFSRQRWRPLASAIAGWASTYAPVCVVVVWLKLIPEEHAVKYLALFAGSGFAACFAGAAAGGWIYKQSESASQRAAARAVIQS